MNEFITIVSGLPRSGTSMMMKILDAGGKEVVIDNIRKADEDNPKGYYEFERVKKIKTDSSWLNDTHGKAFKMVSMLLFDLPLDRQYKIVYMKRNLNEILVSQNRMLERMDRKNEVGDEEMKILFTKLQNQAEDWLKRQKNFDTLYISYNEIMENPNNNMDTINQFLGGGLNTKKMLTVVDPTLYRNREKEGPM